MTNDRAPRLQFVDVSHHYGSFLSVQAVDLQVEQGEFVALVGASGSGKSTLIKMAAGLLSPSQGQVFLDGLAVANRLGKSAYMPQSDALLPWRTVRENVLLGAEVRGTVQRDSRQRADHLLATFGLAGFEGAYPSQLSGGMRQRVAFLRTFFMDVPRVLLDEPLSALDAFTRAELQDWLLEVRAHFDYAVLMVTHDIQEAVYLADRVVVLSPRPGTIIADMPIALAHPRHRHTPEFYETVAAIMALIG